MSRVKMPHNNRVSGSSALRTNDMWSKTIGYDPYAATHEESKREDPNQAASLMLLAKMANLSGVESRGGCSRCGMLGHLTFQCRNPIEIKSSDSESSDSDSDSSDGGEKKKDFSSREGVKNSDLDKFGKPASKEKERSSKRKRKQDECSESELSEKSKKTKRKHKKDKKESKKHKKNKKHREK